MNFDIHEGDVLEILPTLPDAHFDAVFCDPPYGLSFMGKAWDRGVPAAAVWSEVARAMRPGAHLIAAGGTRTFHRQVVNIEDAGLVIRDCLMWLYGSGFPKSYNVSKGIDKAAGANRVVTGPQTRGSGISLAQRFDGYGTALKPAWEPYTLAMKPTDGTFAENAERWDVAGLNVDGGRVEAVDGYADNAVTQGIDSAPTSYGLRRERSKFEPSQAGRWPANLVLDEEVAETVGAASRFFYTAKVSKKERLDSSHPTLKPVALCEYLARLLLPPEREDGQPRRILVPYSGAGSEMIGALRAGWEEVVGIEMEPEYIADAERRIGELA